MADWRALYESWNKVPEETKQLIEKLFRDKPKEKLAELFEREPYAEKVYENAVGKWNPPPPPETQSPQEDITKTETAQSPERRAPKNMVPTSTWNKGAVFLPLLMLIALLSAEIAYYSSHLFTFLDSALPFNIKTWLILLILAATFGLASGISNLKLLKKSGRSEPVEGGCL